MTRRRISTLPSSRLVAASLLLALAACGTRYAVPDLAPDQLANAEAVVESEQRAINPALSELEAIQAFIDVRAQVEPIAEAFCRDQRPDRTDPLFCDFVIGLDPDPELEANAFQTLGPDDQPVIVSTKRFLEDVRNHDELAFVMGHEAGPHISDHLIKKRQQQLAGALVLGLLTATAYGVAGASGASLGPEDYAGIGSMTALGAAAGGIAYSQSYELEADHIGAFIAEQAGYDPELGARIFARLADQGTGEAPRGTAAFWSTHPNSPERIATVGATASLISRQRAAGLPPAPALK